MLVFARIEPVRLNDGAFCRVVPVDEVLVRGSTPLVPQPVHRRRYHLCRESVVVAGGWEVLRQAPPCLNKGEGFAVWCG